MRKLLCLLGLHDWVTTKGPEEDGFILIFRDSYGTPYKYAPPIGRLFKDWRSTVNDLSEQVCLSCEKVYDGYKLGIDAVRYEQECGYLSRIRETARTERAQEILAKKKWGNVK